MEMDRRWGKGPAEWKNRSQWRDDEQSLRNLRGWMGVVEDYTIIHHSNYGADLEVLFAINYERCQCGGK